ncbi:MAG: sulfotransferase family protein [Chloroflexia bacterium]|nr:sulfotransferase family protein [Chloroflexia bacterium]
MSIINHKYKHVFVHVPKTAGTSMEKMHFVGGSGHESFQELVAKSDFNPTYFKWAFVRNPYTRIASAFFYLRNNRRIFRNLNFHDFVYKIEELIDGDLNVHIIPQYEFLKCNKSIMDFIGKYENLICHWPHIIVRIVEITNDKKLLRTPNSHIISRNNVTLFKPNDYMGLYTNELKNKIYKIYEKDFDIFKYQQ